VIYLLIGRRERGKTTLAYSMARKARKRAIIDARRMIRRDGDRVHSARELHAALGDLAFDPQTSEVVYQPNDDDLGLAFESFVDAVKRRLVNNPELSLVILIDEASFYNLDDARFQWIAKCTQREKVHILITAHRPADIPTSIRAIADHWCIFATTQEHDLKVIEQRAGSPRVAEAVRRLRERQYVHWDDSKGIMATCSDSASWYVPLTAIHTPRERIIDEIRDEEWSLD
jgi:hypothetical protein